MRLAPAALLLLMLAACGGASPASESRGKIAFTVNRAGFGEIWTMNTDGTGRRRLTQPRPGRTDASGNQQPVWSPSGDRIAYVGSGRHRREGEADLEIYVMTRNGQAKRRLTFNDAADGFPSWSPNGARIAFARTSNLGRADASTAISTMKGDGSDQIEIAREAAPVFFQDPAWSPDGKTIAYTRVAYAENAVEVAIYAMDSDGNHPRRLIAEAAQPAWSPDGSHIAYVTDRDHNGRCLFHDCTGYAPEIYTAAADGSDLRRVTRSPATDLDPAWSPDGRWIAFARIANENADYDIYAIKPDGAGLRRLTRNRVWDYQPAWGG